MDILPTKKRVLAEAATIVAEAMVAAVQTVWETIAFADTSAMSVREHLAISELRWGVQIVIIIMTTNSTYL